MCKSNLDIYLWNSRECYFLIEGLASMVAKKSKRGTILDIDYLANCSTMGAIMRQAKKVMAKNNEMMPTKEDVKEMRYDVARRIIDEFLPFL